VTSRPLTGASTAAAAFLWGVGADYPDLAWNRQLGFFLRPGGDRTSKDPDRFARAVAISRRVQKLCIRRAGCGRGWVPPMLHPKPLSAPTSQGAASNERRAMLTRLGRQTWAGEWSKSSSKLDAGGARAEVPLGN